MFDSYNPVQRVNVNSVSGTLSKTCKDSYFQCCQIGSTKFDNIVNGKMVVILQVMIMSDKYVMFEVITKADFEKLQNIKGGGMMSFKLSQKYIDFIKDMDVDADFLEGT